ncbi:hypothetical protein GH714_036064 [Hevea brasiliensis]|uniref:RWP-RK domain-containing protein n=1 Tax=Hevea brasiliensis TaxID=3981 RepID=A0A6A6KV39_HEVBR|nr:hypothetical protein GH714_036064 [Hevea brasiliensis]
MDSKTSAQPMNIPKKENQHEFDLFSMDESFEKLAELPALESFLEIDYPSLSSYDKNFGSEGFQELMSINDYSLEEKRVIISGRKRSVPLELEEKRVTTSGRKRSIPLELEEIRKHFDVPITKAAKEMKVGLTVLKKRCRELKIMRWPHRKIRSLKSLINNVKEMGLTHEIVMLEEHQRLLEKKPDMEFNDTTKKLRQAIFKANYKKKRCLAAHA